MSFFRIALLASCVVTGAAVGQVPGGYHLGATVAVPDSLVEVFAAGRFRATVLRRARTARERHLIDVAERLYPSADTILAAGQTPTGRDRLAAMAAGVSAQAYATPPRSAGSPADRWWFDSFDATWLPFSVTSGAVDYYLGRLRDIAAGRGQAKYAATDVGDRGSFAYRATVRVGSTRGVATIVVLRIKWDYWCGVMCAMTFTHTRTVWFDAEGTVVRVLGDERPLASAS